MMANLASLLVRTSLVTSLIEKKNIFINIENLNYDFIRDTKALFGSQ